MSSFWWAFTEQEEREYQEWLDKINNINLEIENDRQRQEYIPAHIERDGRVELHTED
jgi:hypothetical protein